MIRWKISFPILIAAITLTSGIAQCQPQQTSRSGRNSTDTERISQQPQRSQPAAAPAVVRQPLEQGPSRPERPATTDPPPPRIPGVPVDRIQVPTTSRPLLSSPAPINRRPASPPHNQPSTTSPILPVAPVPPVVIQPIIMIEQDVPVDDTVVEYTDDVTASDDIPETWDQFSSFSSRFRSSYAATATPYGIGASISIPLTELNSSELLLRTGIVDFLKGPEYFDGEKATSLYIPVSFAVKTIHHTSQLSNAELIFYSTFGGGPVLGMVVVPRYSDEAPSTDKAQFALAGELFGAIGTEMTLHSGQGVFFEIGLNYLGIAGRTFSEQTSFIAPSLSLGFRFH